MLLAEYLVKRGISFTYSEGEYDVFHDHINIKLVDAPYPRGYGSPCPSGYIAEIKDIDLDGDEAGWLLTGLVEYYNGVYLLD